MIITIVFVSFILLGILDVILRKRFNIERNERFMDQYVGRKHFIFELWLIVMFLVFATLKGLEGVPRYVILFLFFAMVFAIRTLLEYVFKKQSKRHIVSLMYTGMGLIAAIFILFFG